MSANASNALMDNKLRLTAPAHEKAVIKFDRPQQPTLAVRIKDNQPRFLVYTNVEGDKDNGRLEAAMDAFTMAAILEAVIEMADNPDAEPMMFECKNFVYPGGKRSETPVVVNWVVVAHDRNTGCLSIAIKAYDKARPLIVFPIMPTEYHNVCDRNGNVVDNKTTSRLYAKGWAKWIGSIVQQLLVNDHLSADEIKARKEAAAAARGGNGGGGGYNKGGYNKGGQQGGGNGGYNKGGYNNRPAAAPAAEVDDDIPW